MVNKLKNIYMCVTTAWITRLNLICNMVQFIKKKKMTLQIHSKRISTFHVGCTIERITVATWNLVKRCIIQLDNM